MTSKPKRKRLRLRARWRSTNGYIRFGLFTTAAVFILFAILAFGYDQEAGTPRWKSFWNASPNEIGDTIAGLAGTLAFLWIIVTVMIQARELKEQRTELGLTRAELRLARVAQERQLEVMQKQAEIFEDERRYRLHRSSKETLDQLIEAVAARVNQEKDQTEAFSFDPRGELDLSRKAPFAKVEGQDSEDTTMSVLNSLEDFRGRVFPKDGFGRNGLRRKSRSHSYYSSILGDFEYILELTPRLAEDQQIRIHRLGIGGCRDILLELLGADIWDFESEQWT